MKHQLSLVALTLGLALTGGLMAATPAQALSVKPFTVKHPMVISHRGSPLKFPDHSFAGYDYAIKHGSQFIEQDVVLSKDRKLIDFHDNNLKGKLNRDIDITKTNSNQLMKLKFKNGEGLHTLAELFKKYGNKTNYVIEPKKSAAGGRVLEKKIIHTIKKYHVQNSVILQSFDRKSLTYMHHQLPKAPTMLLLSDEDSRNIFEIAKSVPKYVSITSVYTSAMKPGQIAAIRATGKKAVAYTVNTRSQVKEAVKAKVDGIFTDDSYFTEKLF